SCCRPVRLEPSIARDSSHPGPHASSLHDALPISPAGMVPYAGIISGGIAAAAGVYLVSKTVKDSQTRQLVAGGMVASFLHTIIVDLLKKSAPSFAEQVSGLGASDANAVRLSATYGMGGPTSIEPMYSQINGMGE